MTETLSFLKKIHSNEMADEPAVTIRAEGKVKYDQLLPLLTPSAFVGFQEQPSSSTTDQSKEGSTVAVQHRRRRQFEYEYMASFPTDQYVKAHQLLESICRLIGFPHQTFASAWHFFHRYMYIYHLQPHMLIAEDASGSSSTLDKTATESSALMENVDVLVTNRLSQHFINV